MKPTIQLFYMNLQEVITELEDFELIGIIYEICSAMKYLHDNKIIRRDSKMAYIIVNVEKHAKICDFGISKYTDLTSISTYTAGRIIKNYHLCWWINYK